MLCTKRGSWAARQRGRSRFKISPRPKNRRQFCHTALPPLARRMQPTRPVVRLPQPRDPSSRHHSGEPVVPYHTIAFSQQKLRAALRRAAGQEPAFNYGFVVHSRRQNERPALGLITLHGESLAFNERLLKSLDGLPLWLFGHARII